ncbi:T-cell surface glycoprotein CD8 beta chain isoform X2 [Numida meleagris]|uniref:T-cell surface glycoprotein CD8 beta chain isoform X2 n=1 Tax=Numida meleagris TaxID=8996 RepID=UPI000B3DF5E9|nr:T-cell surface glycoprotein CD8 beta chain isoform X2 [Numida meleagris]
MLDMATMARPWLRLWLCLQLPGFCTNLLSSRTPGHLLAQTNNSTEIVCSMKREHTGVYWFRWNQGKQNFEFLLFSSPLGKATYGTNISQEKFSIRGTSSHPSYSLYISRLHGSDNGTYYCCVIQSSQLILGTGTQLSVVDVLPLPSMSTLAPFTKKPMRCKPKNKATSKTGVCSPLVWVPLAAGALLLLLSLISTARRFCRLRRRLWLRAHRK